MISQSELLTCQACIKPSQQAKQKSADAAKSQDELVLKCMLKIVTDSGVRKSWYSQLISGTRRERVPSGAFSNAECSGWNSLVKFLRSLFKVPFLVRNSQ